MNVTKQTTFRRNSNNKVVLKSNTIPQAQKPSKRPVTLPDCPYSPRQSELEKLLSEIQMLRREKLALEEAANVLRRERDHYFDKYSALRKMS